MTYVEEIVKSREKYRKSLSISHVHVIYEVDFVAGALWSYGKPRGGGGKFWTFRLKHVTPGLFGTEEVSYVKFEKSQH